MPDTENEEQLAREALDRMASSLMAAMNDRAGRDQVQRDHALAGAALSFRPPVPAESERVAPAPVIDYSMFAGRTATPPVDVLEEWAQWFDGVESRVPIPGNTAKVDFAAHEVAELLRGPKPFGVAVGTKGAE